MLLEIAAVWPSTSHRYYPMRSDITIA